MSFNDFTKEVIGTGVLLLLVFALRIIISSLVRRFARITHIIEHRTNLVVKYLHLLTNILALIAVILIWEFKRRILLSPSPPLQPLVWLVRSMVYIK
jgi:hypothetical protein